MTNQADKQKTALRFTSEYVSQLVKLEMLVERVVDRKWREIQPDMERLIEQKVGEQIADMLKNKYQ